MTRLGYPDPDQYGRRTFARALAAIARSVVQRADTKGDGLPVDPVAFAEHKIEVGDWCDSLDVAATVRSLTTKSAVSGGELPAFTAGQTSFTADVFAAAVPTRLPNTRRLSFPMRRLVHGVIGAGGGFRKEGVAIPVSPVTWDAVEHHPYSNAGLVVISNETATLATTDDSVASTVSDLLRGALALSLDGRFCSNSAASSSAPAGIAYHAATVGASGSTAAAAAVDLRAMIAEMVSKKVSLKTAVWVMSAEALTFLSILKVVDPSGQTLAGLPIISGAPQGTLLLLSCAHVVLSVADQVTIRVSNSGSVEMATDPTGDVSSPTAASHSMINLFQTDCLAIRASMNVDWTLTGVAGDSSGSLSTCIALTGSSYA